MCTAWITCRPGCHAGVWVLGEGHDREQVCGGADEDVSRNCGDIKEIVMDDFASK